MAESKHRLVIDDRSSLMLNGVTNVDSFAEDHIQLAGSFGGLDIAGSELKIAALDLDQGKATISGRIDSLAYGQSRDDKKIKQKGKRALSRLLK